MRDLERVRFVTSHYEMLQGLVVLPLLTVLGVLFIVDPRSGSQGDAVIWWGTATVGLVAAFAAIPVLSRYYRRRYGAVRVQREQGRSALVATGVVFAAVAVLHKVTPAWPFSPEAVAVGVGVLVAGWRLRPLAPPFVLTGVALIVAGVLPFQGVGHPLSDLSILLGVCCGAAVLLGVWSHLLLRRVLGGNEPGE
ncbi:MAG: hypothetical protein HOY71_04020 [Nonomuraea sp.]|nr:hypothetical protein [Nonomuraea sp.]